MATPTGYDPITLNHWLWYKYLCHEATYTEFQRIFENIIKRARPEFMQIRPYGIIGDRKCDGLFLSNTTIFQVYAPDELRLADLIAKIDGDLDFAADYWKAVLQAWTFVYNARRGVPVDVAAILLQKRGQYPHLTIDHLSDDALWEMARNLTLQQRAEVLGAPAGYEHLFLVPNSTPQDVQALLHKSWTVIIQDTMSPVNLRSVTTALEPDVPFGGAFYIRPSLNDLSWEEAAEYQRLKVAELFEKTWDILPRYAVFSFTQIPLAIQLGFLLSDRVEVRYFQHDREQNTWQWPSIDPSTIDTEYSVTGIPTELVNDETDVIIRISLSAKIWQHQTDPVAPDTAVAIDISVANPDVMWLKSPEQLHRLSTVFREALTDIRSKIPKCHGIHLFYAGPTGGAIAIGRQINPRMNPPIALYQFSSQATPQYQYAITLRDNGQ